MCAVYRVFNLSGKRSCGPGQCRPATDGSARSRFDNYLQGNFGSYQELLKSNSGTQTMRLADVTRFHC